MMDYKDLIATVAGVFGVLPLVLACVDVYLKRKDKK